MKVTYPILLAAALMTGPLALAHIPEGTPKNYCEPGADWAVHDYAVGTGVFILVNVDGNVGGDCDGITSLNPGTPCAGFEDPADPASFYAGLCDAYINPPVADWDGHNEWADGGALILACDWNCGPDGSGAGTEYCFGASAHHAEYGSFTVDDLALGAGATVEVAADTIDAMSAQSGGTIPPHPCGDFESDVTESFIGRGTVSIPAGLDGSYQVYVQGTSGHVTWEGGGGGTANAIKVRTAWSKDSPCKNGIICVKIIF